ncbi:MAG: biotin transporter BioY [Burkholderiales bacterium]|nr:biotin transporter BioY [Anaerolineae bacterium]
MLRTLPQTRDYSQLYRLAGIALFTALTIISAKIVIPINSPVPITLQVLVVLLSGMVLGRRDGALSQLAYFALIAANVPVDAYGNGSSAIIRSTGGYLIGFIPAAYVAGLLVERAGTRLWQRWLAGIAGVAVIYLCGAFVLKILSPGMTWLGAWGNGVAPFIVIDIVKALIAAGLTEGGRRALLMRQNSLESNLMQ